jgi:hypothetical protein
MADEPKNAAKRIEVRLSRSIRKHIRRLKAAGYREEAARLQREAIAQKQKRREEGQTGKG